MQKKPLQKISEFLNGNFCLAQDHPEGPFRNIHGMDGNDSAPAIWMVKVSVAAFLSN